MKCQCCGSKEVVLYKIPEPHLFCLGCLHRRKKNILPENYYAKLLGRTRMLENDFTKKNLERLKFLQPYLKNGTKILELGCEEGSLGGVIKSNFLVNYRGVELSRDADVARTKLDMVWKSMKEIPSRMQFNLVVAFHVLEHIRDIKYMLFKLYNLLCDDGVIIIEVPYYFGNERLSWDFNKEHAHLFSATSILCLLEKQGFGIKGLVTGCYESAIYNDSMRITAYKNKSFHKRKADLVHCFQKYLGHRYVIYGVGGDFNTLVLPYIKRTNVIAIIDGSKDNIGKRVIGKIVQGPERIVNYLDEKFLIATYRYQKEIVELLHKKNVSKSRIVTLEDIFAV